MGKFMNIVAILATLFSFGRANSKQDIVSLLFYGILLIVLVILIVH